MKKIKYNGVKCLYEIIDGMYVGYIAKEPDYSFEGDTLEEMKSEMMYAVEQYLENK